MVDLGDCRSVCCKDDKAIAISEDHALDKSPTEDARLQQEGVKRCIGDHVAEPAFGNIWLATKANLSGILSQRLAPTDALAFSRLQGAESRRCGSCCLARHG